MPRDFDKHFILMDLTELIWTLSQCQNMDKELLWWRERFHEISTYGPGSDQFEVAMRKIGGNLGGMGSFSDYVLEAKPGASWGKKELEAMQRQFIENLGIEVDMWKVWRQRTRERSAID